MVVLSKGEVIATRLIVQVNAGHTFRNLQAKTLERWWTGRALEGGCIENELSITKTYGVEPGLRSKFVYKIVFVLRQEDLMPKRDVWSSFHFKNVSCYIPV